jgi:hypothetical protein
MDKIRLVDLSRGLSVVLHCPRRMMFDGDLRTVSVNQKRDKKEDRQFQRFMIVDETVFAGDCAYSLWNQVWADSPA